MKLLLVCSIVWISLGLAYAQERPEGRPEREMQTPPGRPMMMIGLVLREVSPELGAQLDLPEGMGLVVQRVVPDSPAERAGLQDYDVLTKLDDQILVNAPQLMTLVRARKEGDKLTLTFLRKGKEMKATVTVARMEPPRGEIRPFDPPHRMPPAVKQFHGERRGDPEPPPPNEDR